MPKLNNVFFLLLALLLLASRSGFSQISVKSLFEEEDVLVIRIKGEVFELMKDRTGEPEYRPVTLSYTNNDSTEVSIPIRVKTRGNFRRQKGVCTYPPLLLNFSKENRMGTIFGQQDRIKLVMPCRGEQFVLHEYFTYKLYNLVTEKSFKVRLVQVILEDPRIKNKKSGPYYGILLEEEGQMAMRNQMVSVDRTLVRPDHTELKDFLNMAVFEYMIGNTDWSVQYRQNVKLIAKDSLSKPSTIPYDFDHAGIVGAPYAKPAAELLMSSTKERRFRGFCIKDITHFEDVLAHYNDIKEKVYAVYKDNPLLDDRYIHSTLKYLDGFYRLINDPKRLKEEFQYPCRENGTGHIIIKGLNN
jgi:hypothetical protein